MQFLLQHEDVCKTGRGFNVFSMALLAWAMCFFTHMWLPESSSILKLRK
jgi:hypothetical protein